MTGADEERAMPIGEALFSSSFLELPEAGLRRWSLRLLLGRLRTRHAPQSAACIAGRHQTLSLGDERRIPVAGRAGLAVLTWLESVPVCSHAPRLGQYCSPLQEGIGTARLMPGCPALVRGSSITARVQTPSLE